MSAAEWLSDSAKGIARTVRPAQVEMATLVEKVLQDKGIAMIEAGTGTGKSFGYLVPAILSGKRVVVSTAKKALQKQLRDEDLPFLLGRLPSKAQFASLKGKSNYVCMMRAREFATGEAAYRFDLAQISAFSQWIAQDSFAELDDFTGEVDFANHVRVNECIGTVCDFYRNCGYQRAKSKALGADILIVNHALLAYDLALGAGKLLGEYDALVIDEAHQAARYFREAFTCRIQSKQPEALRKLLADTSIFVPDTLDHNVDRFLSRLPERGTIQPSREVVQNTNAVAEDLRALKDQFIARGVWSMPEQRDDEEVENRFSTIEPQLLGRLRAAATITQRMLGACSVCSSVLDKEVPEDLAAFLKPENYISYVETKQSRNDAHREVIATPVEIGPSIGPALRQIGTVVFTSATLSTGGTFDYISREFGLRPSDVQHAVILPPVFDYKSRSCLYVSDKTAPYGRDTKADYWRTCTSAMDELFTASRGGALVLCASYEDMMAFYDRLAALRPYDYEVRAQSGNVDNLISWFKSTKNGVALGMKSLWEGVDLPGFGLRLVVIPRLPFPNPDDPVFTARKSRTVQRHIENGADENKASLIAWQQYDLQEAIMDFKQGAGRLIRRETDMGVVAVLDNRVFGRNKSYAATIRSCIPHPLNPDLESTKKLLRVLSTKV